jgi:hypothetical protein
MRDLTAMLADLRDRRGIGEAGFQRGMEKILSNLTGHKRDRNLTALKITHNSEDHEERAPSRRYVGDRAPWSDRASAVPDLGILRVHEAPAT